MKELLFLAQQTQAVLFGTVPVFVNAGEHYIQVSLFVSDEDVIIVTFYDFDSYDETEHKKQSLIQWTRKLRMTSPGATSC